MKNILIILTVVLASMLSSCEKEDGMVQFRNRSVTNSTYSVVWDGYVITTLYPQEDSEEFKVLTGQHTLVFKKSNTGEVACSPSDPKITSEGVNIFTCSQ